MPGLEIATDGLWTNVLLLDGPFTLTKTEDAFTVTKTEDIFTLSKEDG